MSFKMFESPKDYLAAGLLSPEFKELQIDIQAAGDKVIAEFPAQLPKWDRSVQDASYLAALVLNIDDRFLTEIRFSRYGKMAVLTNEDLVPESILDAVKQILQNSGFNYISEIELGDSFRIRNRMNGDWFHRFFDYE
jgi:hypothetical protein